jgi:uncharacterized protein
METVPNGEGLPIPESDERNKPFWHAATEGRFMIARCSACHHLMAPPVANCRLCLSDDVDWITSAGQGVVYSYIEYFRAWIPEFASRIPYTVAIIELDEGVRLFTSVVRSEGDSLHIGDRVSVAFQTRGESRVPVFERAPNRPATPQ